MVRQNPYFRLYHMTSFGRLFNRKKGKGEAEEEGEGELGKREKENVPFAIVIQTTPEQVSHEKENEREIQETLISFWN